MATAAAGSSNEELLVVVHGEPPVEQDTAETEDIPNLARFLLQDLPTDDVLQLSFSYNKRVFDGWVRQPSACCGAASVAGALNALGCWHRTDAGALSHVDVLRVYHSMFLDLVDRHTRAFERRLGAPLGDLVAQVEAELAKKGREIGGRKGYGATKVGVVGALKRLARVRLGSRPATLSGPEHDDDAIAAAAVDGVPPAAPSSSSSSSLPAADVFASTRRDAIDCIIELFELDGVVFMPEIPGAEDAAEPAAADEEEDDDEECGGDEADDDRTPAAAAATTAAAGKGKKTTATATLWDWKKDFMGIVKNIAGMRKITAVKASTAAVGNWGILQVTERLSEWMGLGTGVSPRLFMGKRRTPKTKIDAAVAWKDDTDAVTAQWATLTAAFARPDTVLLSHHKNHYALIFAIREWLAPAPATSAAGKREDGSATTEEVGDTENHVNGSRSEAAAGLLPPVLHRQLLTARKGQRPTAWIDFDEYRETLLGWEGYKYLAISTALPVPALRQAQLAVPEEYTGLI